MPTTEIDRHGWTTSAELAFVAGMADSHNGIEMLSGYIAGMQKRTQFSFDAALCIRVAQEHLDEQMAALGARRRAA